MGILARITNTVHLVVAKKAAQARGIVNLINSAQSGRPLPNPMSRSNASLNKTPSLSQVNIDDTDDEDDDDSEEEGAKFGSRTSLGNAVSQNSVDKLLFVMKQIFLIFTICFALFYLDFPSKE